MADRKSSNYCFCCKKNTNSIPMKIPFGSDDNNEYLNANPFLRSYYGLKVCVSCKKELERHWVQQMGLKYLPLQINRKFLFEENKKILFERLSKEADNA